MFILLSMIFLHIVDDYYLQGFLAQAKQKSWWEEHYPQEQYKKDYLCALATHGFSWAFMIMLPLALASGFAVNMDFVIILAMNGFIHSHIDNLKANCGVLNLTQDQSLHLVQIAITYFLLGINL